MLRLGLYGLLALLPYTLFRLGILGGLFGPDRLARFYLVVAVPVSLVVSAGIVIPVFAFLAVIRRATFAHVRWYFLDAWLTLGFVLAIAGSVLTVPLRDVLRNRSADWARARVERALPESFTTVERESFLQGFDRFWYGTFLKGLASRDAREWEGAWDQLDWLWVFLQDDLGPAELERLEKELGEKLKPPAAPSPSLEE